MADLNNRIIIVDDKEVEVPANYTVLQACEIAGAEIPRFCYHERLSIAGNCRMCLVEVKGAPKPQASCALGVKDLRPGPEGQPPVVNTKTPLVKKAREGVMEFLLINHPLDCPICDQGGECDLQDQAMAYGVDTSRYDENKRAVENKYIGPLVKTIMTRCIHCTRCVRFATEVAGVQELGAIGRGEDMEITTYLEQAMTSEMQGNVIDLCPVGALTSRPYAYQARPWELNKTEGIDVMDAVGSNIRIDTRGREVMRIMPRLNEAINEEWISDKTRFVWDGLKVQRLDKPYIRENRALRPASWQEAFQIIADKISETKASKIGALVGDLASAEEIYALKLLMNKLGTNKIECRQDNTNLTNKYGRAAYLFNTGIENIEQADALLVIGSNPRFEAATLNAKIRKQWLHQGLKIGVIGEQIDTTWDYDWLGNDTQKLNELSSGKGDFFKVLEKAKRPMIIIGQGALQSSQGEQILAHAAKLAYACKAITKDWNGFNVLHTAASRAAALDIGFIPEDEKINADKLTGKKALDVLFMLGADEVGVAEGVFTIYIGTHGDRGAHRADVILPSATYTEKSGLYVNTEGRVQLSNRANFPPGDAREDWSILRALSAVLERQLPFDSLAQLREHLVKDFPHFAAIDELPNEDTSGLQKLANEAADLKSEKLPLAIENFYLTNPIARASAVMGECASLSNGNYQIAAE